MKKVWYLTCSLSFIGDVSYESSLASSQSERRTVRKHIDSFSLQWRQAILNLFRELDYFIRSDLFFMSK